MLGFCLFKISDVKNNSFKYFKKEKMTTYYCLLLLAKKKNQGILTIFELFSKTKQNATLFISPDFFC